MRPLCGSRSYLAVSGVLLLGFTVLNVAVMRRFAFLGVVLLVAVDIASLSPDDVWIDGLTGSRAWLDHWDGKSWSAQPLTMGVTLGRAGGELRGVGEDSAGRGVISKLPACG